MKIILNESQRDNAIKVILNRRGINTKILYWQDNGYDSITGTVYLYKDGEVLGHKHGYEFFYKYDSRFDSLKYEGHYPKIETLDLFRFMPSDMVIEFFSDKVKDYLRDYINKGYSTLRRK